MAKQAEETGFHFGTAEAVNYYAKGRFTEENARAIQAAEQAMDAVDADIMSDQVVVPRLDPQGFMLSPKDAPPRLLSLSADMDQIQKEADGTAFAESQAGLLPTQPLSVQAVSSTIPAAVSGHVTDAVPLSLAPLGLGFLTTPPSPPEHKVKLQFEGQVKLAVSLQCHAVVVTEHVVVLVTDKRVQADLMEMSLGDAEVTATLTLDGDQVIKVLPPVPQIVAYDIGVLRHFLFVRIP